MATTQRPVATRARTAVLAGAVLWGSAGTAVALGPPEAAVWQVAAIRLGVGAPLLLAVSAAVVGRSRFPRPAGIAVLAAGALAVFQIGYFAAVTAAGVALGTAVSIGSAPIAAGALQWVWLRVRPARGWWPATALAVAGVSLLLGASAGIDGSGGGVAAGLAAAVAFATFTVASRRVLDEQPEPLTVMAWLLLAAGLPLVLLAVALTVGTGTGWGWVVTGSGLGSLAWLVVAATAVAYVAFASGLVVVPPASAATLTLAEPLTAVLLGLGLLAERPTIIELIGAALVLAGLVVLLIAGRRATSALTGPPR